MPDPILSLVQLLSLAALFYLLIPVSGAFYVRRQWRIFRKNLRHSLDVPLVVPRVTSLSASLGLHRFLGQLEAIEGSTLLWIRGKSGTITADMKDARIYKQTDPGINDELYRHLYPYALPKISLSQMPWSDIFSLTEGTRLFLFGNLDVQGGKYCLRSTREIPLTVIIYNEDPFTLIPRCIWSGRQTNELWNFLTPWSILTGSLLLLISTLWQFQNTNNYGIQFLGLSMALLPVILFLPPGVFLFNLYQRFWEKGKKYRAERDLMRLSLSSYPAEGENQAVCEDETEILFSRKPTGWPDTEEIEYCCYGIPEGLLEMSDIDLKGCCISYPADPELLAAFCQKRAFLYEALSGIVLVVGMFLNYLLIWFIAKGLY
ncbi:hypothetical protein EXM22_13110 [Oceanispirochaeta crateris]|uniref:Uncharacterized protein n=1 Tax=Oceanispirochaeta crateris TaxID=2518645 RepID=A0A5C1QLG6_9SPIO|nr:hypothetical protein [Oceanispirochaeta crateris]QEN08883.1 hypothetical protein EXM22_13110 [Oceanispirochaeta crateris]